MSDFAKAQLLKYGWTEGKGLGKNENGIAEALKPKLKFDTAGIGHKDIEYGWWNSIFDKAAKNIVCEKKSDEVSINVVQENAFNISSSKTTANINDSLHYGKFLKTSTLQDGNTVRDSKCPVFEDETNTDPFVQMTDEDLFKACGGRTAHKGARHGLTLNGKLNRVAEQEKLLSSIYLKSSTEPTPHVSKKKQKKCKKRKASIEAEDGIPEIIDKDSDDSIIPLPEQTDENYKPSKKTCKKVVRKIQDLTHQLNRSCMIHDDSVGGDEENSTQDTSEDNIKKRKNKKKKKSKRKRDHVVKIDNDSDTSVPFQLDDDIPMEPSLKRSKKDIDLSQLAKLEINESSNEDKCNTKTRKTAKCKKKCEKSKTPHYCPATEAQKLNDRITKKKNKKLLKKEKRRLKKLAAKNPVQPAKLKIYYTDVLMKSKSNISESEN